MDSESEKELILQGQCVVPGTKEGTALVLTRSISAFGGIDPYTSEIVESGHPQKGSKVKKKVLIFPNGKGSSGFSLYFHMISLLGNAPRAMIICRLNSLTALGAVVGNIPTIAGPFVEGKNPLELINTGDKILVDASSGNVFKVI